MNEIRSKSATDYRKLKKQWKLLLKNEWELNFTDYRTHRLYDGLVTEKMMVDYLLSLNPRLHHVYKLVNDLRFALHNHDFELFRYTLEESRRYALPRKVHTIVQTLFKHREGIHNACLYTFLIAQLKTLIIKSRTLNVLGLVIEIIATCLRRLTASRFEPKALQNKDETCRQGEK